MPSISQVLYNDKDKIKGQTEKRQQSEEKEEGEEKRKKKRREEEMMVLAEEWPLVQKGLLIYKQVDLPICLVGIMTLSTRELNKAQKKRVNMRARRLLQQLLFMARPACPKGPIFT